MDEMPGCILDDLEDAGMCPDTCTFEGNRSPGQYIRYLEEEIDYLANERNQLQDELHELKATTLIDFIAQVKQELHTAKWGLNEARKVADRERELRKEAENKWDMWDKLHHGIRS
jgi:predicted RNase H-like nuclease (RuvC/YqgF family)